MSEIDNQQVSDLELGWLAGAFDADGHVGMFFYPSKHGHNARVEIGFTNTSRDFLCMVLSICKRLSVNLHIKTKSKPKGKSHWNTAWAVCTGKFIVVHRFLNHLIPLLTVKRERAELLFDFCERRIALANKLCDGSLMRLAKVYGYTEDDIWYFDKVKELNKKPTPTTIPKGSRGQEAPKYKTQSHRLDCDDIV